MPSPIITTGQALIKIRRYCALQERCQMEVRQKLLSYGMQADDVESVICDLIVEGYINETRYATAFARGKFNIKGWGKHKITAFLKAKGISTPCIKIALREISDEQYAGKLQAAMNKWLACHHENSPALLRQKLIRHLLSKGYSIKDINAAMACPEDM